MVMAWLRIEIPADHLFYIRIQQIFGLLCLVYWYVALVTSPLGYVFGKERMKWLTYNRRAIGVSAFYFAFLHGVIALWGQLGGIGQLEYLPDIFKWSLTLGVAALVVLGVMAATSFDSIVRRMTFKRWKLLHRCVYGAGVLAILHIWLIGTHLAYTHIQILSFVALGVLFGLELFKIVRTVNQRHLQLSKPEEVSLFFVSWAIACTLLFMLPIFVENYHSRHTRHEVSFGPVGAQS